MTAGSTELGGFGASIKPYIVHPGFEEEDPGLFGAEHSVVCNGLTIRAADEFWYGLKAGMISEYASSN